MERDFQRYASVRASRRQERNNLQYRAKDDEDGFFSPGRLPQDYPMKIIWKRGFIRLVLVGAIHLVDAAHSPCTVVSRLVLPVFSSLLFRFQGKDGIGLKDFKCEKFSKEESPPVGMFQNPE